MDNMEKITWRIWQGEELGRALLIGGLIFYVPVINLLLLGYFGRWLRQLARNKGMNLPEWRDGKGILDETGRVILPFLAWVFVPWMLALLLVWALMGLLAFLKLEFFAYSVAFIPLVIVAVFSPIAVVSSLLRFFQSGQLKDAFAVYDIIRDVIQRLRASLFPLLQFYGLLVLGYPLLGFAVFLATPPLLAQLVLVFRRVDADLKSSGN